MRYKLEHLLASGSIQRSTGDIGFLAFCKHLAFAGFGVQKSPMFIYRYLGFFFEWRQYWQSNPDYFSILSPFDNDPTERSYISNKIGCAYADYFAKKLYGAKFTHAYEDAMVRHGYPVKGERPDYYCDNLSQQFAVESKGLSKGAVSQNEMTNHKQQSQRGPVPVNFTAASVAYDLYQNPKVKFHDPANDNIEYSDEINLQLRSLYLSAVLDFLESLGAERSRSDYDNYFSFSLDYLRTPVSEFRLLVHRAIISREWMSNDWLEGINQNEERDADNYGPYIDLDGIGLTRR
jgi:hypothetical protein